MVEISRELSNHEVSWSVVFKCTSHPRALDDWEPVIRLAEAYPDKEFGYVLGYALHRDGRFDQALSQLKPFTDLMNQGDVTPENVYFRHSGPTAAFHRAMVHFRMGQDSEARVWYQKARLWLDWIAFRDNARFGRGYPVARRLLEKEARELIQPDPREFQIVADNPYSYVARGQLHWLHANHSEALLDFGRAIERLPENTSIRHHRADLLRGLGQHQQAIADYTAVIELDPDNLSAVIWRGNCYRALGQFEQALADMNRALELPPRLGAGQRLGIPGQGPGSDGSDPWPWLARGDVYRDMGKLELAIADYSRGISLETHNRPLWLCHRADCYRRLGIMDKAIDDFTAAIDEIPRAGPPKAVGNYFRAFNSRGDCHMQLGDHEQAAADFVNALKHRFDSSVVTKLMDAEQQQGRREYSAERISKIIESNPDNADLLAARGQIYHELDESEKSLADYNRAIELESGKTVLWKNRATTFIEQEKWPKAAEDLQRAIELGDGGWQTRYDLALCQLGAGDTGGYRKTCRRMIALFAETDDPLTANFAAWTCCLAPEAVEDWQPVLKLARMAVESLPDSIQYQNTLGTVLFRAGQPDEAIEQLLSVNEQVDTESPAANVSPAYTWFALALACHRVGQSDQAQQWREKAVNGMTENLGDSPANAEESDIAWNWRRTLEMFRTEMATTLGASTAETDPEVPVNEDNLELNDK
jgi:tetratricopeptide (TPR) repeat protein